MAKATACSFSMFRNKFDHSHSLNGEDQMLLPTLISATKGERGTFVELGAFTGEFSNTAVLERCFGWSGLLIEANVRLRPALAKRRRQNLPSHRSRAPRPAVEAVTECRVSSGLMCMCVRLSSIINHITGRATAALLSRLPAEPPRDFCRATASRSPQPATPSRISARKTPMSAELCLHCSSARGAQHTHVHVHVCCCTCCLLLLYMS